LRMACLVAWERPRLGERGALAGRRAASAPPKLACCASKSSAHAATSCRKGAPVPVKPCVCSTCAGKLD